MQSLVKHMPNENATSHAMTIHCASICHALLVLEILYKMEIIFQTGTVFTDLIDVLWSVLNPRG